MLTEAETTSVVSSVAHAIRGPRPEGRVRFRASLAELLLYPPGLHRVHPAAVAFFYAINLSCSLISDPDIRALWQQLWVRRNDIKSGIVPQLHTACSYLEIDWVAPFEFRCGDSCIRFGEVGLNRHSCRELLRLAEWKLLAQERSKEFSGAESGIQRSKYLAQMMQIPCSPSLLTAGQFTHGRMYLAKLTPSGLCVRCGSAFETLKHRLWECPADEDDRVRLFSRVRAGIPMPNCLMRCGLAPASSPFSCDEILLIQEYLLTVAGRAVAALASTKPDAHVHVSYDFDGTEDVQNHVQLQFPRLRSGALVPCSSCHLGSPKSFKVSWGFCFSGFPRRPLTIPCAVATSICPFCRPPPWPSDQGMR